MQIATVAEMREMDRRASQEFGITSEILMENAGEAAYHVIRHGLGVNGKKFAVVCGGGNNGGDGFVVARKLHSNGAVVRVLILTSPDRFRGAARQNLDVISRTHIDIHYVTDVGEINNMLTSSDAIIDAIFGTGLDRDVGGLFLDVISMINKSSRPVFSLDIPSGVNGDTGREMGISIKADYTITFGLPKTGNLLYPGYERGGRLYVTHISFPPELIESVGIKAETVPLAPLPERKPDTNKMDYGPVLVIAGAVNYFWAPHASAYSFLKAGGGYVHLACPGSTIKTVARKGREVVFQPQIETTLGSIAFSNKPGLLGLSSRMRMVVLGPGISQHEETQRLVRELAAEIDRPLLVDGDGITAIAGHPEIIVRRKAPTVLTPHTGEMARITGLTREEIEKDRLAVLRETARKLNAVIVLKGPHSLIGYPDGRVKISFSGSRAGKAGMATAGAGDVLNGTVAAMFCLGQDFETAVSTGVFIHGLAGDIAAEKKGADGMTAQDILNNLPYAVRYYRENLGWISENSYDTLFEV